MAPLTPKQQQIRFREKQILELARPMIADGGLATLSMDAIAQELQTAKGTIYNHFPNKEEIVLALAVQALDLRLSLFNRAVMIRGGSRQRIAAIGIACEVYVDEYSEWFHAEQIIRHETVWGKTSEKRQEILNTCEIRCMDTVAGVIRDAVAAGDLEMSAAGAIEDICFGLWSLVYGGLVLEATSPSLADVGIGDARGAIRRNCNALLDGLGWQPLYEPTAYAAWAEHVHGCLVTHVSSSKPGVGALPGRPDTTVRTEKQGGRK